MFFNTVEVIEMDQNRYRGRCIC